MFKKILVPVDGSSYSDRAVPYAVAIAEKFGAEVVLLHAYQLPVEITDRAVPFASSTAGIVEIEEHINKCAKTLLDKYEAQLQEKNISVSKILKEGSAGATTTETAEEEKCDLIIIGSRGLSTVKSYILGSVTNYVMHHSKCPVFVVH